MTTVLFVHGLESGPHGAKARALAAAGFDVVAVQMPCGQRRALRDPAVIASAAAAIAVIAVAGWRLGGWAAAAGVLALAAAWPWARRAIVRRMLARSVAVQRRALAAHAIDVVVGSSFGGAVGLELLRRGWWRGPTVLLCPAHALVAARGGRPVPTLAAVPEPLVRQLVVVHGAPDEVVPLAHSQALVDGSAARLIVVDDDHRLTATATAANLAAWIAAAAGRARD